MNRRCVWSVMAVAVFMSGCKSGSDEVTKDGSDSAAIRTAAAAPASNGDPVLEGVGTAQVDGVVSPGEWDDAGRLDFDARIPGGDGGGTTPATILAMHDATHLYLALRLQRAPYGGATQPIFEFDNDNDGQWYEPGDDIVHALVTDFIAPEFWDVFRHPCPGSEDPAFAGCSSRDVDAGGTTDGAAAASHDEVWTTLELSHPLDGADDAHDFSLAPGAIVGFQFMLRLFSLDHACNEWPDCAADTFLAVAFRVGGGSPPPGGAPFVIDIEPGSQINPLNPSNEGVIPVAVLGSAAFDAAAVDASQACFGDAEDPSQRDCTEAHGRGHVEDVNADGIADLVLHFETREAGIDVGDVRACLGVATPAGSVEACDVIRTETRP